LSAYRIRIAGTSDVAAIVRLCDQLGYAVALADVAAALEEMSRSREHCALVAMDPAGAVIGWIHVFRKLLLETPPFAEIGGFVVDEAHRGRGAGRSLLAAVEAWARENTLAGLHVRVNTIREGAFEFYESAGFRIHKTQRVYVKNLV